MGCLAIWASINVKLHFLTVAILQVLPATYHIPIDKMARAPRSDEEVERALSILCNVSPVSAEIQRTLDAEAELAPEGQEDPESFYGYEE